jgi:hypothetical protein
VAEAGVGSSEKPGSFLGLSTLEPGFDFVDASETLRRMGTVEAEVDFLNEF